MHFYLFIMLYVIISKYSVCMYNISYGRWVFEQTCVMWWARIIDTLHFFAFQLLMQIRVNFAFQSRKIITKLFTGVLSPNISSSLHSSFLFANLDEFIRTQIIYGRTRELPFISIISGINMNICHFSTSLFCVSRARENCFIFFFFIFFLSYPLSNVRS